MRTLNQKVALVTGASKGIGKAITKKLAENGAHVAFTYLSSKERAKAWEKELSDMDTQAKAYCCDAGSYADTAKVVEDVIAQYGRLDILVNNAGIIRDGLLMRMEEQAWDDVVNTNLKSVFNTTKAAVRTFIRQKGGSIINISSIVGIRGNAGQANYAAAKAGIIGFTKSMALELAGKNIRVNAIAPGLIQTAMTESMPERAREEWSKVIPLKRVGNPEDIANCVAFLASDDANYITGQVIQVDGGLLT